MASTLAATGSMAADYLTSQRDMRTSTAEVIARAALAECQKKGYTVAVAVTDRSGTPLAILRDDMAGAHTPSIAIGKAWTAANFRMSTTEVVAVSEPGQPAAAIRNLPNVVALGGGLPIQTKGTTIGAIGVSGAPGGHLDEACAQTAVKSIQSALDLP
ncbi:MAG: heme-binding protein [Aquabacterium sp.]|nr:MAG: heme-binding protein [Aquabacterium sp.]